MLEGNSQRPLTALVIGRDAGECERICRVVGQAYPVLGTDDAGVALRIAHASHPDFVVLGVDEPRSPREQEMWRLLKSDPELSGKPLIVCDSEHSWSHEVRTAPVLAALPGGGEDRKGMHDYRAYA